MSTDDAFFPEAPSSVTITQQGTQYFVVVYENGVRKELGPYSEPAAKAVMAGQLRRLGLAP